MGEMRYCEACDDFGCRGGCTCSCHTDSTLPERPNAWANTTKPVETTVAHFKATGHKNFQACLVSYWKRCMDCGFLLTVFDGDVTK